MRGQKKKKKKEKKKDLRHRGRLLVLTGMVVDQWEGKPGLGGFQGRVQASCRVMIICKSNS